jgi:hypothetical protein
MCFYVYCVYCLCILWCTSENTVSPVTTDMAITDTLSPLLFRYNEGLLYFIVSAYPLALKLDLYTCNPALVLQKIVCNVNKYLGPIHIDVIDRSN